MGIDIDVIKQCHQLSFYIFHQLMTALYAPFTGNQNMYLHEPSGPCITGAERMIGNRMAVGKSLQHLNDRALFLGR